MADDNTMFLNTPLKEIKLKKNILIVCITHGIKTEIPNGESSYQTGDTVIVVTSGDKVIYQLNDILNKIIIVNTLKRLSYEF